MTVAGRLPRFHLSTAVAMMLAASGIVYLNTLPVWHYTGAESGQELFEISGYGWPCEIYSTGLFYGHFREPAVSAASIVCNVLALILIAGYTGLLCEWRRLVSPPLKRGLVWGTALGLIAGGLWFGWLCFVSGLPVISPVSLSIGFKPWWQNWRSAAVLFLFAGAVMGTLQMVCSRFRPWKIGSKHWWN